MSDKHPQEALVPGEHPCQCGRIDDPSMYDAEFPNIWVTVKNDGAGEQTQHTKDLCEVIKK